MQEKKLLQVVSLFCHLSNSPYSLFFATRFMTSNTPSSE